MLAARFFSLLLAALFFALPVYAQAQSNDPCPGEGRIATEKDTGFPVGSKICPSDGAQDVLKGGCAYDPYPILEKYKSNSGVFITPRAGNQGSKDLRDGIDPALACRLTKLIEWALQNGCNVKIESAYRSATHQAQTCKSICGNPGGCTKSQGYSGGCAPPGSSCHQYGLAVDMTSNNCSARLSQAARQFGLISNLPGYPNPSHFQCIEHGGGASRRHCTKECSGGAVITPDMSITPGSGTPTSGIANQFRQALGMQPPQQPFAQPQQQPITSIPNAPIAQQTPQQELPQPTQSQFCLPDYKCSGSTLMFQNSFCATQAVQVCSKGCANGACIAATATSTPRPSTTTPKNNDDKELVEKPRASSTLEILEFLSGNESTVAEIGTSTPLQLLLSLTGDQVTTIAPTTTQSQSTSSVLGNAQYMTGQQTFMSGDLKDNVSLYQQPVKQNNSALFAILEQLKQVLLWTLNYIQPFSPQRYGAHVEIHMDE